MNKYNRMKFLMNYHFKSLLKPLPTWKMICQDQDSLNESHMARVICNAFSYLLRVITCNFPTIFIAFRYILN